MKNEELYLEYVTYLDWRLNESQIKKGKWSLLRISRQSFEDFKNRFENDETFNDMIIELMKTEIRDKKIDDIFDDFN
jgi:predicted nucleic acid-binding OB-fold protein